MSQSDVLSWMPEREDPCPPIPFSHALESQVALLYNLPRCVRGDASIGLIQVDRMLRNLFLVESNLADQVRLPAIGVTDKPVQWIELAALVGLGVVAAAITTFVDLGLKIPGHAILRVIFPITLGLAIVPRRGSGACMGLAAAVGMFAFSGVRPGSTGIGAMTSLILCGMCLDFVAARVRSGWPFYVGLAATGLTVNMVAFTVKLATKLMGFDGGGKISSWLPRAIVSYPACGLAAGLVCAIVLFRLRPRKAA